MANYDDFNPPSDGLHAGDWERECHKARAQRDAALGTPADVRAQVEREIADAMEADRDSFGWKSQSARTAVLTWAKTIRSGGYASPGQVRRSPAAINYRERLELVIEGALMKAASGGDGGEKLAQLDVVARARAMLLQIDEDKFDAPEDMRARIDANLKRLIEKPKVSSAEKLKANPAYAGTINGVHAYQAWRGEVPADARTFEKRLGESPLAAWNHAALGSRAVVFATREDFDDFSAYLASIAAPVLR